jgi:hypothetical protein
MPATKGNKKKSSDIPKTELELQQLQELYLKDRNNQEVIDKYFFLLRVYARSIALKVIKRKGIYLPPERVDEISTDATLLLLDQYSKEGWKVTVSFAGILIWKVYEAMYDQAEDEQNSSLNTTFTSDKDSKEVIDMVGSGSCLPWTVTMHGQVLEDNPSNLLAKTVNVAFSEISGVIEEAYQVLPYKTFMRFVPWLVLKIRKAKTRNIESLFKRLYLTSKEEDAFDILLLEIHNRVSQHVF